MSNHRVGNREWLLPVAIGLAGFLWLAGPRVLLWDNLGWLTDGDVATHYLGWLFFRQTPWAWPLGMNPSYGLELSSAIVYSDSNPLLALLFKPFAAWLPETFQYFGLWMLMCFVLQAWLGWRLAGLATPDLRVRAAGAVFFLLSPMMLVRLTGHLSLGGQFLLLGALYLVLAPAPRRRRAGWAALLVVSVLVHAYLAVMVVLFWLVDLATRRRRGEFGTLAVAVEVLVLCALAALACWQAGYFVPGGGTAQGGYGYYRANLLALVDPMDWSRFVSTLPSEDGDNEGFAYLGLGVFFLYACALPALLDAPRRLCAGAGRHVLLGVALLALALFAFSHNIGLGRHEWTLPIPTWLFDLAGVFRASGRMLWPAYYVLVLLALVLVVRAYDRRTAFALIAFALVVQIVDGQPGRAAVRGVWTQPVASAWDTPLRDPFWQAAAQRYTQLRWVPPRNAGPHWKVLADYAGRHGMATDAVYLARVDAQALARLRADAARRVRESDYAAGALYVLDDVQFRVALIYARDERDLFARIDGFNVIAPGWRDCVECPQPAGEPTGQARAPALQEGARLGFGLEDGAGSAYLGGGWSHTEVWGTWSDGLAAELLLPLAGSGLREVALEVQPFVGPGLPRQRVRASLDGEVVAEVALDAPGMLRVPVPPGLAAGDPTTRGLSRVLLELPDAARPMDVEGGGDQRRLGVGLRGLQAR